MSGHFDKYGFEILKPPVSAFQGKDNVSSFKDDIVEARVQDYWYYDDDYMCHIYDEEDRSLENEWQKVFSKWDRYRQCVKREKLKALIKVGIPMNTRPELWRKLLEFNIAMANTKFSYEASVSLLREELIFLGVTEFNTQSFETILSELEQDKEDISYKCLTFNPQFLRQIVLDVGRTYPTHFMFSMKSDEGIEGRASLFRLLAVYTLYNPEINYCQGMSYLAAMFLMQLEEKDAFWAFVSLLERRKYLWGYFHNVLERVESHAKVFEKILNRHLPRIHHHLNKLEVEPLMYTTQWVLCVFTSLPCWDTVLTVWDLLLLEGNVVIFQTALAILKVIGPSLLKLHDTNRAIKLLQNIPHCV
ncbi:TBC1 domain family member 10B-like [Limulus polyphemus]|uniref:TBC1 domain family member 10B-like n=1 Tax=Limulus polyphemus TaxID=6850 RepID=A0ABM1SEY7_LIMPO|nr:TBC1 domain family member 10B-like [Limulus polyphemus]